jgi:hypothetical protein
MERVMDDRTLLEKAARAAGIAVIGPVEKFIAQFEGRHKGGFIMRNDRGGDSCWNPLTDDGDALRLAVKLGLTVCTDTYGPHVKSRDGTILAAHPECKEADALTAVRRQIVRAAAAIGEKQ